MAKDLIDLQDEELNREYQNALDSIAETLSAFNSLLETRGYAPSKRVRVAGVFFSPLNEKDDGVVDLITVPGAAEEGTGYSTTLSTLVGWECDGNSGNRCYYYWRGGQLRKCCCYPDPNCPG